MARQRAHRISGRLAFLLSLPVAYHCLYQLGFQHSSLRVLVHSILGCLFYGAFAAKVLIVRSRGLPGSALPIAGGLVFVLLVYVWLLPGSGTSINRASPRPDAAPASIAA